MLVAVAVQVAVCEGEPVVVGDDVGLFVALVVCVGKAVTDGVHVAVSLGELDDVEVDVKEGVG